MANHDHKPYSSSSSTFVLLILLSFFVLSSSSQSLSLPQALIKFKSSMSNNSAFDNWNASVPICNGDKSFWFGITCKDNSFWGIRLENLTLTGEIDIDSLMNSPVLVRSLSLMNNSFQGPLPDVRKLGALKALYMSDNRFSDEIDDGAFQGMRSLKKIYLARNQFTGKIPNSLAGLPSLLELGLEENRFVGQIPNFSPRDWKYLNFSDNRLEGPIPDSFGDTEQSAVLHNKGLCGKPLGPCERKRKWTTWYILIGLSLGFIAIASIVVLRLRLGQLSKSDTQSPQDTIKAQNKFETYNKMGLKEAQSPDYVESLRKSESGGNSLCFVRDGRQWFDLEKLLRASAEVLGSGNFGSSYKASLLNGPTVVVKRFKKMNNVGREEFHEHMKRLGRLSHPNLLPLVAFYYRKDDKLLVSDFVESGSLASHLHGKRAPGQPGMDWPTRLKIVKGVARGLSYLHQQFPNLPLPHGHLKSSNVLLTQNNDPILTDYALSPLINREHAHHLMIAFKSPEFSPESQQDRTSRKTDVWSLGILILELLTGRFPANYLRQGNSKEANDDLAAWVSSVVREEWTGEVFDTEMRGTRNGDVEMLKLLKIGMCCCEWEVERRWELAEAVEKIEALRERDVNVDDDYYSSFGSEADLHSSKGMVTEDEFSFLG